MTGMKEIMNMIYTKQKKEIEIGVIRKFTDIIQKSK